MNLNVGKCIYCGTTEGPLTREHVLPRGLGGNDAPEGMVDAFVLQKASCESCRVITQSIEEKCLINMMDPARAKLGLKRKDRIKKTTTAHVDFADGCSQQIIAEWDQVPGPIVLPSFYEAGFFSMRETGVPVPCDYKIVIVRPATVPIEGATSMVGVELTADPKVFAQMLVKIALGAAVAHLGFENFYPLVRDVILQDGIEYGHWVGGYAGTNIVEEKSDEFHSIKVCPDAGIDGTLVVVEICLFAEFGAPTNYVVVGKNTINGV